MKKKIYNAFDIIAGFIIIANGIQILIKNESSPISSGVTSICFGIVLILDYANKKLRNKGLENQTKV